jgi:hypothetical protein
MKNITSTLRVGAIVVVALYVVLGVITLAAQQAARTFKPLGILENVPNDPALQGAIDLHAHQDPDGAGPQSNRGERVIDGIDLARRAKASGMRGFVVKQHLAQSAGLAYYLRKLHPDLETFGGVGLNRPMGGVNPSAVWHMTEFKGGWGRIVWMPTQDSVHDGRNKEATVPVSRNGELVPEAKEVISIIAKAKTRESNGDLVLATGHNSPEEVLMMVREAQRVGVKHVIVTHPLLESVGMSHAQMREAAKMGAFLEFVANFAIPGPESEKEIREYVDAIRAVGVQYSFVSSDHGQNNKQYHPDGLALAAKTLRSHGFTEQELNVLFKENPARILGLPLTPARPSASLFDFGPQRGF